MRHRQDWLADERDLKRACMAEGAGLDIEPPCPVRVAPCRHVEQIGPGIGVSPAQGKAGSP